MLIYPHLSSKLTFITVLFSEEVPMVRRTVACCRPDGGGGGGGGAGL